MGDMSSRSIRSHPEIVLLLDPEGGQLGRGQGRLLDRIEQLGTYPERLLLATHQLAPLGASQAQCASFAALPETFENEQSELDILRENELTVEIEADGSLHVVIDSSELEHSDDGWLLDGRLVDDLATGVNVLLAKRHSKTGG